MTHWHELSKRKNTGGKYKKARKRKKHELGSRPTETTIGQSRTASSRTRGGNKKIRVKRTQVVNLCDGQKSLGKIKVESVLENTANREFVRRNILTKGAIVETSKGNARVTSRPGQDGTINAILVK